MIKFTSERTVLTTGAMNAIKETAEHPMTYIQRHFSGDWGDACKEDAEQNERYLPVGGMLMSTYRLANGLPLWVITDPADEGGVYQITTLLLPEEY